MNRELKPVRNTKQVKGAKKGSGLRGSVSFSVVEGSNRSRRLLQQGASSKSLDENADNADENARNESCDYSTNASNESLDRDDDHEADVLASCESLDDVDADQDESCRNQRAKFRLGSMTDDMCL
jgi:hypothetical protein